MILNKLYPEAQGTLKNRRFRAVNTFVIIILTNIVIIAILFMQCNRFVTFLNDYCYDVNFGGYYV